VDVKQLNRFHRIFFRYILAGNAEQNIAVIAGAETGQFVLNAVQRNILRMTKFIQSKLLVYSLLF
jgi:hypothetical protein